MLRMLHDALKEIAT